MSMKKPSNKDPLPVGDQHAHHSRRKFLQYAGGAGLLVAGLAGCRKYFDYPHGGGGGNGKAIDLGKGDVGILNYAYALEQLEAAFYTKVIMHPYSGIKDNEKWLLTDIR